MSDETRPLLESNEIAGQPKDYSTSKNAGDSAQDNLGSKSKQTVSCRVCHNIIAVANRAENHVVKCSSCGEATPIRNPPPGKKYVRCPCNCLLICNSSAPRIACPRQNCRRVISLSPTPSSAPVPSIPGMARVICVHCKDTFLFNTLKNTSARCPHCRKMSSVGPDFARSRGHWYLVSFLMSLILSATVTGVTYQQAKTNSTYIVFDVACFVMSFLLLGRSIYFYTMKVSAVGGSV